MNILNIFKRILPIIIILIGVFVSVSLYKNSVNATSVATLLGGKTEGIEGYCCNGLVLGFESVDSSNSLILDGDAIYIPGPSRSYSYYLESSGGSCTVGTVTGQMVCFDPKEDCAPGRTYPLVGIVGTSESGCEYDGGGVGI